MGFGIASLIVGLASLVGPLSDAYTIYRAIAFFALSAFCFSVVVYEQKNVISKARWYLAVQPPALFVLLFVFFNILYAGTVSVWFPILMDVFGFTFAILIILYLSSLFNWKTVGLFAVLLTALDIILGFQRTNGYCSTDIHWTGSSSSGLVAKLPSYFKPNRRN